MVASDPKRGVVIDFRYHLISLVAVFLALALGILLGSATLGGDNVTRRLQGNIESVRNTNDELRADNAELTARQNLSEEALQRLESEVLDGRLAGRRVVVFQFEGSDDDLVQSARVAVETADGVLASTITLTTKLSLDDGAARAELARILATTTTKPGDLRAELGEMLGRRAAIAGDVTSPRPLDGDPATRLDELVGNLERAGFVRVERDDAGDAVPIGADFLVVGGDFDPPAFDIASLAASLGKELAGREAGVLAAEPRGALWGPATAVRADREANDVVATVDQADIVLGQYAVALGLENADAGAPGHYGSGPGTEPLPEPSPAG